MSYTRSPRDILSELSSQIKRNLSDIRIDVLGTKTMVLRIEVGERDLIGDYDETLVSNLTANVIIKHPMGNNQWIFSTLNSDNDMEVDAINLWEILPVKMKIKYNSELDLNSEPVAIKKDDIIVELLQDENYNNIQVIYQVTKLLGGFEGKYLYEKEYELNLYRGTIPSDIQNAIYNYIARIESETTIVRTGSNVTRVTYNETLNILDSYVAGVNLAKYRVVMVNENELVYYADHDVLSHINKILGIEVTAINKGGNAQVQTFGELRNFTWNWNVNSPIFLGNDGSLTQEIPITGFILEIGKAITPDNMFINIQQPIVLA